MNGCVSVLLHNRLVMASGRLHLCLTTEVNTKTHSALCIFKASSSLRQYFLISLVHPIFFQEYNASLSRIRSFLAGTRSRVTLQECDRLLTQAKKHASAMQALAEVEG